VGLLIFVQIDGGIIVELDLVERFKQSFQINIQNVGSVQKPLFGVYKISRKEKL